MYVFVGFAVIREQIGMKTDDFVFFASLFVSMVSHVSIQ